MLPWCLRTISIPVVAPLCSANGSTYYKPADGPGKYTPASQNPRMYYGK